MNPKHPGRATLKELGSDFHVEGKSVLDVGSSLGHFCLEAMKHGAASVTGIDVSFEKVNEARELAKRENASANFIHADFDDWQGERNSFDIVVCANTLHHLYDPLGALRKMMQIAREKIILEIIEPTWREILRSKHSLRMIGSAAAPVILLRRQVQVESTADQTFLFSKKALSGIFNHHSRAFEPILFRRSKASGRLIVEMRRRQIDHLIVIAGAACVGKSRFIDRLKASPELRSRFGVPSGDFEYVSAHRADQLPSGPLSTVVFHYDILRPFGRALISHQRDPAFHLLQTCKKVTVLTLVQSRDIIIRRSITNDSPSSRRRALAAHYAKKGFLSEWYGAWSDAVKPYLGLGSSHHFVLADDDYQTVDRRVLQTLLD